MTYRELYEKAAGQLRRNKITLGEYDEMTKPLDEEIRKVGKWIKAPYDETLYCSECNLRLDDEQTYIPLHYCPNCGIEMIKEE